MTFQCGVKNGRTWCTSNTDTYLSFDSSDRTQYRDLTRKYCMFRIQTKEFQLHLDIRNDGDEFSNENIKKYINGALDELNLIFGIDVKPQIIKPENIIEKMAKKYWLGLNRQVQNEPII